MTRNGRTATMGALTMLGAAVLVMGCTPDRASDQPAEDTETLTVSSTTNSSATTTAIASGSATPGTALTAVDPGTFISPQHSGVYTWNYSTGGRHLGLCVSDGDGVTCSGTPGPKVPDLTEHFPGRPSAIELSSAGLRYTFIEGIPAGPGRLEAGQMVQIANVHCARPDEATLECSSGSNSFAISGPGHSISTSGMALAESYYSNHPVSPPSDRSESRAGAESSTGQPTEYMGATGLVGAVRTSSGRIVQASVPACDGRGILILESYVETADPQQGIADLLDSLPGAEFATPGQCPSLHASLYGARVYPIYVDHGHDTAALCAAKASRGGNARLLATTADYVDPCGR